MVRFDGRGVLWLVVGWFNLSNLRGDIFLNLLCGVWGWLWFLV